jgi:hypothetical protein
MPNINTDLRYRHVVAWQTDFDPAGRGTEEYALQYAGECVKSACRAGIIVGLNADEVDDMPPSEINELAGQVVVTIAESLKPKKKT